jgi:hypothetical protein
MRRNDRSGGFTVIEGIIALSIISVIGFFALSLPGSALRALNRSLGSLFFTFQVLKAEALIRDRACAVHIPYWEKTVEPGGDFVSESPWISVPWYQGDPQGYLRIYGDGEALFIETTLGDKTEKHRLLENPGGVLLTIPRDSRGQATGIGLSLSRGGQEFSIRAPFAGIPLTEADL